MRKFILIAAMVLVSATAQAGQSRSLTLAANDDQTAAPADQPKAVEAPQAVEAPKFVERPAPVEATTPAQPPKTDSAKPVTAKVDVKADKPHHKPHWTEARIIGELHRHGIYW